MPYLKPSAITRKLFNPLAMRFGMFGTKTLSVPGRASGSARRVPVIPVEVDGAQYVVSTRGESDWVRNLRAAGRAELDGKSVRATELPPAERAPVIAAYRAKVGRETERYWREIPSDADHPVFRIE